MVINNNIFKEMDNESKRASAWLAETWGEPEWMQGYGYANTHRIAVAPTKSTALIMGGISEGINPDTAMVYTQRTPAGEVDRINPVLLKLMQERGVYNKTTVERIRDAMGSVQQEEWLNDQEKEVFRTAFEIPQMAVLTLASARAKYIDQWQSLNLFFAAGEDESYINDVHKQAFLDQNILGLYYVYSRAGVQASKDECLACQ
jgi:ribonucleoside-diphosphate reductase alpha chain